MLEKRLDRAEIDIIELESKVKEMEKTLDKTLKTLSQLKNNIKELEEEKKCLWLEREGNCKGCEGKENKTCPLEVNNDTDKKIQSTTSD